MSCVVVLVVLELRFAGGDVQVVRPPNCSGSVEGLLYLAHCAGGEDDVIRIDEVGEVIVVR